MKIRIGEEFRPEKELRTLYYIHTALIFVFGVLSWYVPVVLWGTVPETIHLIFLAAIGIAAFALFWISLYYNTIKYQLTRTEMVWRRGVWFRATGIVPYNRITNIDIGQGPISRMLGISSLKIQTAGYSAQAHMSAEIKIEGVRDAEQMREMIMSFVRGSKPTATETYDTDDIRSQVLSELVRIRKLLSKKKR